MEANDLLRITSPSGGGYGDPRERDPELVLMVLPPNSHTLSP